MIVKNARVRGIIEFIEKFKVADVTQIARMFFGPDATNQRFCQRKLTALVEEKTLKRKRSDLNSKYCYYIEEPKQITHKLLVTELYVRLHEIYPSIEIDIEYTGIQGIRPDAYMRIKKNGHTYIYFVEVQLNSNFDLTKYEKARLSNTVFPEGVFPTIVVVTDRKLNLKSELNFIVLNENLEGVENL